jgi:glycosyltransferase involved in cell wall biosynthesis
MKVCFFGIYNSEYSRNRVLMAGFRENGYDIVECKVNPRIYDRLRKYSSLYKEYKKIKHIKFDYIIVAFPGHSVVWFAYLLFGKKIIFDAFLSLYNSEIEDRKKHKKISLRALYFWILDWYSCSLSSVILLDTNSHIKYFVEHFNIPISKFRRVFVGTNPDIFYPIKENVDRKFTVHFHGTYIPLQGIEYIVRTAKLLEDYEDIQFRILGNGQEYQKIQDLSQSLKIQNIKFLDKVDLAELNTYINNSDICLGIFGDGSKTDMVIPNKIYEYTACGKPVITAETSAIKELFTNKENILLCNKSDPQSIADSIMLLYKDNILREVVAGAGYGIFKRHAKPRIVVKNLLHNI